MARILVVDDDRDLRAVLKTVLKQEGHVVDEADSGQRALEMMEEVAPDVVVLDVMMPVMDGFSVLKQMKSRGLKADIKVVILTARTAENDWVRGYRLGADHYLTKPFDPQELVDHIAEIQKLSPEQLRSRRQEELEKAELLARVESIFHR